MWHLLLCGLVWTLLSILVIWRLSKVSQDPFAYVKRLHQIPCSKCVYFTGDYRLKCTVNPIEALTESAISCRDFELRNFSANNYCQAPNPMEAVTESAISCRDFELQNYPTNKYCQRAQ